MYHCDVCSQARINADNIIGRYVCTMCRDDDDWSKSLGTPALADGGRVMY